jgi:hypothetical protein
MSDKVRWWQMGRAAKAQHGVDKATELAKTIKYDGIKALFLSGVNGEKRPRVRPQRNQESEGAK